MLVIWDVIAPIMTSLECFLKWSKTTNALLIYSSYIHPGCNVSLKFYIPAFICKQTWSSDLRHMMDFISKSYHNLNNICVDILFKNGFHWWFLVTLVHDVRVEKENIFVISCGRFWLNESLDETITLNVIFIGEGITVIYPILQFPIQWIKGSVNNFDCIIAMELC